MSHLSFLGCEPARCGNWAARGLEFKRTVGVPHGVRKRRGLNAIFRPPTGFSRDARVRFRRDAGLSCRWLLARQLTLVVWTAAPAPRLRAGRTPQPSVHESSLRKRLATVESVSLSATRRRWRRYCSRNRIRLILRCFLRYQLV